MSSSSTGALRPHRTLVVRLSAVGDVVHTLPAAAALAAAGHAITWAIQPRARPLVERNPAVAGLVEIPARDASSLGELRRARRELRAARVRVALDFQGLWKSAGWAWLSGAKRRIGFDRAARKEPGSALLLNELHPLVPQGISADLIATLEGFSRRDLDAFAAESQRRCEVAQKEGRFEGSLVPVRDAEGYIEVLLPALQT